MRTLVVGSFVMLHVVVITEVWVMGPLSVALIMIVIVLTLMAEGIMIDWVEMSLRPDRVLLFNILFGLGLLSSSLLGFRLLRCSWLFFLDFRLVFRLFLLDFALGFHFLWFFKTCTSFRNPWILWVVW